jgi:hypothetical protein
MHRSSIQLYSFSKAFFLVLTNEADEKKRKLKDKRSIKQNKRLSLGDVFVATVLDVDVDV